MSQKLYSYTVSAHRGVATASNPEVTPEPVSRLATSIDTLYKREIIERDLWPDLNDVKRLIVDEIRRIEEEEAQARGLTC